MNIIKLQLCHIICSRHTPSSLCSPFIQETVASGWWFDLKPIRLLCGQQLRVRGEGGGMEGLVSGYRFGHCVSLLLIV